MQVWIRRMESHVSEKLIFDEKGNKIGVEYVNTLAEVGGALDSRQFQTIGSYQPRFFGGFSNTFTYKQVSLSVLITYALKYVIRDNPCPKYAGQEYNRHQPISF